MSLASKWRPLEFELRRGRLGIDVTGTGRFACQTVMLEQAGGAREVRSVEELADALASSGTTAAELARAHPIGLGYLVCLLSGRPRHIFPGETLWPQLEKHLGLSRAKGEPQVEGDALRFVTYSQYMPVLKVSRMTIDLRTLDVSEDVLVEVPWPPVEAGAVTPRP